MGAFEGAQQGSSNVFNELFSLPSTYFRRNFARGENKYYAQNQIPWLVAGAQQAGIHPLFALGGSANFSPSFSAGASGARGSYESPEERRLRRLQGDWIEEQIAASKAARGNQGQPHTDERTGVTTFPVPTDALSEPRPLKGRGPTARAQQVHPYEDVPKWITVEGPDGRRMVVYSRHMSPDEINQYILIPAQEGWDAFVNSTPFRLGAKAYNVLDDFLNRRASQAEIHRKGRSSQGYRPAVPLP